LKQRTGLEVQGQCVSDVDEALGCQTLGKEESRAAVDRAGCGAQRGSQDGGARENRDVDGDGGTNGGADLPCCVYFTGRKSAEALTRKLYEMSVAKYAGRVLSKWASVTRKWRVKSRGGKTEGRRKGER
jgi:hypothetical protein